MPVIGEQLRLRGERERKGSWTIGAVMRTMPPAAAAAAVAVPIAS